MPKYMVRGNYVGDGVKGLMKEGGTSRREAVEALVKSMGGSLEGMWYAFGDTDVYVIADLPDNATAAAVALVASSSGAVSIGTTVLMTPEEIDEAAAKTPEYRPPGG